MLLSILTLARESEIANLKVQNKSRLVITKADRPCAYGRLQQQEGEGHKRRPHRQTTATKQKTNKHAPTAALAALHTKLPGKKQAQTCVYGELGFPCAVIHRVSNKSIPSSPLPATLSSNTSSVKPCSSAWTAERWTSHKDCRGGEGLYLLEGGKSVVGGVVGMQSPRVHGYGKTGVFLTCAPRTHTDAQGNRPHPRSIFVCSANIRAAGMSKIWSEHQRVSTGKSTAEDGDGRVLLEASKMLEHLRGLA